MYYFEIYIAFYNYISPNAIEHCVVSMFQGRKIPLLIYTYSFFNISLISLIIIEYFTILQAKKWNQEKKIVKTSYSMFIQQTIIRRSSDISYDLEPEHDFNDNFLSDTCIIDLDWISFIVILYFVYTSIYESSIPIFPVV